MIGAVQFAPDGAVITPNAQVHNHARSEDGLTIQHHAIAAGANRIGSHYIGGPLSGWSTKSISSCYTLRNRSESIAMPKFAGMIDKSTLDRELADYANQRAAAQDRIDAVQRTIAAAQNELSEASKAYLLADGAHQAISALLKPAESAGATILPLASQTRPKDGEADLQ